MTKKVRTVTLDALVLLKILQHCRESSALGRLVGVDEGDTLTLTNALRDNPVLDNSYLSYCFSYLFSPLKCCDNHDIICAFVNLCFAFSEYPCRICVTRKTAFPPSRWNHFCGIFGKMDLILRYLLILHLTHLMSTRPVDGTRMQLLAPDTCIQI